MTLKEIDRLIREAGFATLGSAPGTRVWAGI